MCADAVEVKLICSCASSLVGEGAGGGRRDDVIQEEAGEALSRRAADDSTRAAALRRSAVSLAVAREGKEQLAYCVTAPAASDSASHAVLSAEVAFCAARPAKFSVYVLPTSAWGGAGEAGAEGEANESGDDSHSPVSTAYAYKCPRLVDSQFSSPRSSSRASVASLATASRDLQRRHRPRERRASGGTAAASPGAGGCCEKWTAETREKERSFHSLTTSRVLAAELFFDATLLREHRRRHHNGGLDELDVMTLPVAILSVVEACGLDLQRELLENIHLVGGSSLIPGLAARLQAEVTNLIRRRKAHSSILPRVHTLPSALQLHAVAAGGFRFALGPQFDLNHISRHQYEEYGTSFLERFSVRGRLR
ncbi:actin-like family protein [Besnoitia besnoiti]|uniref:Actin-like family protein n=1 Tax=Besnoitia besnoiti TaxID=94643 RepID=A0A2A9MHQ6_BESBE|nr:actin-like family protein [Besnoitia besnoiti]PFH35791.1 actin-like family protein [Besnoitia besnoiti]